MPLKDNISPIIEKVSYNSFSVKAIKDKNLSEKEEQLLLDYPTVYIIDDELPNKNTITVFTSGKPLILNVGQNNI